MPNFNDIGSSNVSVQCNDKSSSNCSACILHFSYWCLLEIRRLHIGGLKHKTKTTHKLSISNQMIQNKPNKILKREIISYGIQRGKSVTHRLQKGCKMYFATSELSTPLYLYLCRVATPWWPMYPIYRQITKRSVHGSEDDAIGLQQINYHKLPSLQLSHPKPKGAVRGATDITCTLGPFR
jgi:hypothetical protein